MATTVNYWTALVRNNVRNVTEDQASEIGLRCFNASEAGEISSVWHHSAAFFGTQCHCAACEPSARSNRG